MRRMRTLRSRLTVGRWLHSYEPRYRDGGSPVNRGRDGFAPVTGRELEHALNR